MMVNNEKRRGISGFTMAELLIVVAIIGILSSVSFIAVQRYQRSMAQLERNTIAKEIYFAAQNHLTMAYGQGYLGLTEAQYGSASTVAEDANKGVYYVVNGGHAPQSGTMLDLMLPFASIDEQVRSGGSYLIRYQPETATVLDVFYCSTSGSPSGYNHTIADGEYAAFMGYKNNLPGSGYVVGWYGGGEAGAMARTLSEPSVTIENGDKLTVNVQYTPPAEGEIVEPVLELIISGEKQPDGKQARMVIVLQDPSNATFRPIDRVAATGTRNYTITLDDITALPKSEVYLSEVDTKHFADLNLYGDIFDPENTNCPAWFMAEPGTTEATLFRPGEDITVEAVAFSNEVLSNIAYGSAKMANSLFADNIGEDEAGNPVAAEDHSQVKIANFRHLENLGEAVSDYRFETFMEQSGATQVSATQIADLVWTDFADATTKIYKLGDETGTTGYLPVNPGYALAYDGRETFTDEAGTTTHLQHTISSVTANVADNAGLFGKLSAGSSVSNLELIDFSITSTGTGDDGNAGALAGAAMNATFTNVLAHNSTNRTAPADVTAGGDAGGLVGSMTGGTVEKCAAALTVQGSGDAGGLVGSTSAATTVTASYAGGHTEDAAYKSDGINVTGGANAGGLIGDATGATIRYCYSTCSVSGATAGGLVGVASVSIRDSYCTGLVSGAESASKGAFAGELSGTPTIERCLYYGIVNDGLSALGGEETYPGITELDADTDTYNAFVGDPDSDWRAAQPYDATLATYYSVSGKDPASRYNLKTVDQLDTTHTDMTDMFVATHYGDWPALETLVVNTPE